MDVFFAISGFLITLLLMRESNRSGRVSLRAFYARRALRIIPAYLAFLGAAWFLTRSTGRPLSGLAWLSTLTYTTNFLPDISAAFPIAHAWSLSVEEHFYLVWPGVFALVGRSKAMRFLLAAMVLAPVSRYGLGLIVPGRFATLAWTPARMDVLAGGCLLAYLVASPTGSRWIARASRCPILIVFGAIAAVVASKSEWSRSWTYLFTIDRTVTTLAICVAILACVSAPRSLMGRVLDSRPMVAIGILSYSLYLWQQPFLDYHSTAWICRFPRNLGLAVVCAIACHGLIERPFLRLKDRLGRPGSPHLG